MNQIFALLKLSVLYQTRAGDGLAREVRATMMSLYSVALFLHILGAFGLVAAFTVQAIGLIGLRRASTREEALVAMRTIGLNRFIAPGSMALILVPGLYMMATTWGFRGWIIAGLAGLLLIGGIGGVGTGVRMARLGPVVGRSSAGALSAEMRAALQNRVLTLAVALQAGILLGVLFDMTIKPSGLSSAIAIVVGAALGLAATRFPFRRHAHELHPAAS
jgi:hypothetical protein